MKLLRKVILENFESGMRIIRPTKDTLGKPNNARTNNIISLHGEIAKNNNRTRNNADLHQNAPPNPPAPKNPDALPKTPRKRSTRVDSGLIPLTLPMIAESNRKRRDQRDRAALTNIYSKNWSGALPSPPPQKPMPPGAPPQEGKDGPAAVYLRSRRDSKRSGEVLARKIAKARKTAPGTQPSDDDTKEGRAQAKPRKQIKAGKWKGSRYPHDLGRTVPKEEADKWEPEDRR